MLCYVTYWSLVIILAKLLIVNIWLVQLNQDPGVYNRNLDFYIFFAVRNIKKKKKYFKYK